jgi:hypothetical protein
MIDTNTHSQSAIVITAIRALLVFEATTFLVAASVHLGATLPLGVGEPRILPAAIVEGLAGVFCAGGALAVIMRKPWAWYAALAANLFALFGVTLGILALAIGYGPSTSLNGAYHRVMLGVLVVCILLLLTPTGRSGLADEADS